MWFPLALQNMANVYRLYMGLFAHESYFQKRLWELYSKKYFHSWKYYGIVILDQLFLNIVQLCYSNVDNWFKRCGNAALIILIRWVTLSFSSFIFLSAGYVLGSSLLPFFRDRMHSWHQKFKTEPTIFKGFFLLLFSFVLFSPRADHMMV